MPRLAVHVFASLSLVSLSAVVAFEDGSLLQPGVTLGDLLVPGSSSFECCEPKYAVVPGVAEFFNTLSNVGFFVFPVIFLRYCDRSVRDEARLAWAFLMLVGFCSAYFHATLSWLGEILDAVAMIWALTVWLTISIPDLYLFDYLRKDRRRFIVLVLLSAVISSFFSLLVPGISTFVLVCKGISLYSMVLFETWRLDDKKVTRLVIRLTLLWAVAFFCLLSDPLLCSGVMSLRFSYLHALWHLVASAAAASTCALCSYFRALERHPRSAGVALAFWPSENSGLASLPYVVFRGGGAAGLPQDAGPVKMY